MKKSKADELGLTPEEYACCSILAQNDSTSFLDALWLSTRLGKNRSR